MPSYHAHYRLLQVLPDADPEVIEAAYKALMKKHHPDKHPAGPVAGERLAADLNRAWHVLRDPDRRALYDAEEKARQERHKVELARAFPDPPPRGAEPARRPAQPPPAARAGQRLAAGIGLLGIAVLVGAVVMIAREPANIDPQLAKQVSAPEPTEPARLPGMDREFDEAAFRALPVNRQQIFNAVAEFKRIAERGGMPAAARYSEKCFADQARSRGLGEFDFCVAFDHAAGRTDLLPAASTEPRFQPQSAVERHVRAAAGSLSKDTTIIETRLFEIRRLTDSALADLDPSLSSLHEPADALPPPREAARQRTRPPAPPRSRPAQSPARAERQPVPADFLEREGGIY